MAEHRISLGAAELISRRRAGRAGSRLPQNCRPSDLSEAWDIQQQVTRDLGQAVSGWKCALPVAGKLIAAPIYADAVFEASCSIRLTAPKPVAFEPEIGYVLGQDLPPRAEAYTVQEIDAAVRHARCALEVVASRYADDGVIPFHEHLADGLLNTGLVLGPVLDDSHWQDDALILEVEGQARESLKASHPDKHPRAGLYWLANFLREKGMGLQEGQIVITGSLSGVLTWPEGKKIGVHYGDRAFFAMEFNCSFKEKV